MRADTFTFEADDGRSLFVYRWRPDEAPRGIVHVVHGMAEHAGRYARLGAALAAAGWAVTASDLRGHGKTARWSSELGFFAREHGFRRVSSDVAALVARDRHDSPGAPVVLLGHSMGAAIVQLFLIEQGGAVEAAVLSGASGKPGALATAGLAVARLERRRLGERGRSALLTNMSFGNFNRAFRPNRTAFDWLSRDEAEVDKYAADPRCGFAVTTSLWVDVLEALSSLSAPSAFSRIPKDLPLYVFGGSLDPVGENTRAIDRMLADFRAAGLRNVKHRHYPGARHEMLNETNRDEVMRDLLAWLEAEVAPRAAVRQAAAAPRV